VPTIWDYVDTFAKRFGRDATLVRSRALMIDCLSRVERQLPEVAAKALEVAKRFHSGAAGDEERSQAREECWRCLTSKSDWCSWEPENCILRAAAMSLDDARVNRGQPEAAVIEWFFSFVEKFEGCKPKPFEPYTLQEEELLEKHFRPERRLETDTSARVLPTPHRQRHRSVYPPASSRPSRALRGRVR